MKENEQMFFETPPEHIPTYEEVFAVFKRLTEKECIEVKKLADDNGIYLLEVIAPGDSENEKIGYAYMRKGRYEKQQSSATSIYATYYKDNIPFYGANVAEHANGNWKIIK